MNELEAIIERYNNVKIDLMKISRCIDCCHNEDKELYQELAAKIAEHLREIQIIMKNDHELQVCGCCIVN